MDEVTKKATARALEWLAHKQNSDGSWSTDHYPHNSAITSFALLAFLSQGYLPGRGLYGPEVARGSRFLMACAREDGYLVGARDGNNGNMYCHAMTTLVLAELWGMTGDDRIKLVLKKAVDLIVRAQNPGGGWRYQPKPDAGQDVSVTVMQVMALRAAKNSGLAVPDTTLAKALAYIKSMHEKASGGFSYADPGGGAAFARSAAGVCILQLSGAYDAKEIPKAVAYLRANRTDMSHYWYGRYYAAHAMHQVGGTEWENWYAEERKTLLEHQDADGSWSKFTPNEGVGPAYQTSIGVIILSVPAEYLPIFQR